MTVFEEVNESDIRVKVALFDGFKEYSLSTSQKVYAKSAEEAEEVRIGYWVWMLTPNYCRDEAEINRVMREHLMSDEVLEILMTCDSPYEKCVSFLYKMGILDSLHVTQ